MNIESIKASGASQPISPTVSPTATARLQGNVSGTIIAKPVVQAERSDRSAEARSDRNSELQAEAPLVEDAVEKLSSFVSKIRPEISFSVDQSSGTRVVKILDSQSKELIRQIPSEEAVQLAQALDKLQGLFVREKA